jgi:3-methyladenine DNA glycosylase/8-oxoguanine DNA glycosylase
MSVFEIPLTGPKGEPVDLRRTFMSHGVADLPPGHVDEDANAYVITLALASVKPRTVRIVEGRPGFARVEVGGRALGARATQELDLIARRILNLDEDLSEFYVALRNDPELAWAANGAGRMLRTPSVFEAVVKTVCTTNCAWSATIRMVTALVEHLGEPAANGDARAFPTPAAMAGTDEDFYRDVVRAGYRAGYLRSLAAGIAEGTIELEELDDPSAEIPDDDVALRLLALPGIGPYGTAHMMMLLGRHSRLILDSWTRPKYARLRGRKATDVTIEQRFRRYGPYAGLAFWLYLTKDWVPEDASGGVAQIR